AYCSQERGSNENLNGLVRRFFPKKTDFAAVTDEQLHHVEYLLNTRPRKRFGGLTPLEVLFKRTGVAITY
ncbi:MAG: transposase, partial [Candidatus Saccharimonadales bacterium]